MPDLDNLTPEQEKKIQRGIENNLKNLPLDQRLAVNVALPHFQNGATWGFDSDDRSSRNPKEFIKDLEEFKNEGNKSNLIILKLKRGFVADYPSLERLRDIYKHVFGPFGKEYDEYFRQAQKRREEALADLLKYTEEKKSGIVGFFNTNSSTTMTISGKTHPSFNLNVNDFLGVLGQRGYSVYANDRRITVRQALGNVEAFMKTLEKSPSSNAVVVQISPEDRVSR